jgi:hypothetical protein
MTVTMTVNATGAGKIAPANRHFANVVAGGDWAGSVGTTTTAGQVTDVASWQVGATGQHPTNASLTFDSIVNTAGMTPGAYTGSLNFTATAP